MKVGIDLAKNVFQIHGMDEQGKAVLKEQLNKVQDDLAGRSRRSRRAAGQVISSRAVPAQH